MTVTYIDPTAAAGGDGSLSHPYNSWTSIQPGSSAYLQKDGTSFDGLVYLDLKGTATSPITIGSYGNGGPPAISGGFDFDNGAQYIIAAGFNVTNPAGDAVTIQNGSNHISIVGMTISGSKAGIWLGNYAGSDNGLYDNLIQNSVAFAIGLDTSTASAGHETVVAHNTISQSGLDGIEVTTNHAIISSNTISGSGLTHSGTAGIHVVGGDPTNGFGNDNAIVGNVSLNNRDATFVDGEGILLDKNVSGNIVSGNLVMGNDGPGIADYDSGNNTIIGNTMIGNAIGPASSHPWRTELFLGNDNGQVENNVVSDNTALASDASGYAVYVYGPATVAQNSFSGNVYENTSGRLFNANGVTGDASSLNLWNAVVGGDDFASGVLLNSPGDGNYDYTFPINTYTVIDGRHVRLIGWSATRGLTVS